MLFTSIIFSYEFLNLLNNFVINKINSIYSIESVSWFNCRTSCDQSKSRDTRGLLLNFAWGLANCRQACQIINGRMCEMPTCCCCCSASCSCCCNSCSCFCTHCCCYRIAVYLKQRQTRRKFNNKSHCVSVSLICISRGSLLACIYLCIYLVDMLFKLIMPQFTIATTAFCSATATSTVASVIRRISKLI